MQDSDGEGGAAPSTSALGGERDEGALTTSGNATNETEAFSAADCRVLSMYLPAFAVPQLEERVQVGDCWDRHPKQVPLDQTPARGQLLM